MKIGIDISQIAYEGTGVARFTRGLVESILGHNDSHRWVFFYSSLRKKIPERIREKIQSSQHTLITLPFPPTLLSFVWNTLHILPIEWVIGSVDWFISSDWTEPPARSCKKATIVHDLAVFQYPDTVHTHILHTQKKRLTWVQQESDIIITDSQATQADIAHFLKLKKASVIPLYPGVQIIRPNKDQCIAVRQRYKLQKPFILSVGKLEPRKNIDRLIQAFHKAKKQDIELILVGPKGWDSTVKPVPGVRMLGYVNDNDLSALYELCECFVYPSLWEGFGYPVVEAMLHHKPILTSSTSSLREVGCKGALLCDPLSVTSIQKKLETLLQDKTLREKLADEGFVHAQTYTWDNYYNKLIETLSP